MNKEWRNDPITERQIGMLRRVDEYFTFDRLESMTKGEASDYIKEYFDENGIIKDNINMRHRNELVVGKNVNVKSLVEDVVKMVCEKYGV